MREHLGHLAVLAVLAVLAYWVTTGAQAQIVDLSAVDIVDLTYTYNEDTIYWPNSPSAFEFEQLAHGETEGGYFYSANKFCTPEHGGTHMDAPVHFSETGRTIDNVPAEQLILPAVVIDITKKTANDPDYRLQVDDIEAFESLHGPIAAGSAVIIRTGWEERWPDVKAYLGDDRPGQTDALHFPSFGEAAVRLLVGERQVAMIGIDTASIDYGQSSDFIVHQISAATNVPGLENLKNLDELPATGATLMALPIKIEGGSGGPVRVLALVPRVEEPPS